MKGDSKQIDNSIKRFIPLSSIFKDIILKIQSGFTSDKNGETLMIKYK